MKADIQVVFVDIDTSDVGHAHAENLREAHRIAQHYIDTARFFVQIQIKTEGAQLQVIDHYTRSVP